MDPDPDSDPDSDPDPDLDPDSDPGPDPAIFVIDLQDASKKTNFLIQFFLLITF
jgi:hypothetical protein